MKCVGRAEKRYWISWTSVGHGAERIYGWRWRSEVRGQGSGEKELLSGQLFNSPQGQI